MLRTKNGNVINNGSTYVQLFPVRGAGSDTAVVLAFRFWTNTVNYTARYSKLQGNN